MVDVWAKESPGGKTVTFKVEGDRKAGFVYSVKMDGRDIKEIEGFLERLRVNKWKRCSPATSLESRLADCPENDKAEWSDERFQR
jgi:hypothetical protein